MFGPVRIAIAPASFPSAVSLGVKRDSTSIASTTGWRPPTIRRRGSHEDRRTAVVPLLRELGERGQDVDLRRAHARRT